MDDTTPPPPPQDTAPPLPAQATTSGSPTDFLKGVVGKRVVVRLTSGVDYRGTFYQVRTIDIGNNQRARRSFMSGRLHEHRAGTDGGARKWQSHQSIRRRVYQRKQWSVFVKAQFCSRTH
jgi:hypothetical protein